jgi:hypothetical protein
MPILIDEILEKDQQELSDLSNDEILNRSALEILQQETGFLRAFVKWDQSSSDAGVTEPEYEVLCRLIRQYPDLLEAQFDGAKDRFMLV